MKIHLIRKRSQRKNIAIIILEIDIKKQKIELLEKHMEIILEIKVRKKPRLNLFL